jgi:hypothetical protein
MFRLIYSHHQADYKNKKENIHSCIVLRSRTLPVYCLIMHFFSYKTQEYSIELQNNYCM